MGLIKIYITRFYSKTSPLIFEKQHSPDLLYFLMKQVWTYICSFPSIFTYNSIACEVIYGEALLPYLRLRCALQLFQQPFVLLNIIMSLLQKKPQN